MHVQDEGDATGKVGAGRNFRVWPVPAWPGIMGQEGFALTIPGLIISKESSSLSSAEPAAQALPGGVREGEARALGGRFPGGTDVGEPRVSSQGWTGASIPVPSLPCCTEREQGAHRIGGLGAPGSPPCCGPGVGRRIRRGHGGCWGSRGWGTRGKGVSQLPGGFWSRGLGSEGGRWGGRRDGEKGRREGVGGNGEAEDWDHGRKGPGREGTRTREGGDRDNEEMGTWEGGIGTGKEGCQQNYLDHKPRPGEDPGDRPLSPAPSWAWQSLWDAQGDSHSQVHHGGGDSDTAILAG